jgi:hypothetical protein
MIGIIELGLLWFAHCMGDMVFQTEFIATYKSKFFYAMFTHVFIWSATICIALAYLGLFHVWKFIFLILGHYLIDKWKSNQPKDKEHLWCIYADQFLHLAQIMIVWGL